MIGGRKKHSPLLSRGNRAIPLNVVANFNAMRTLIIILLILLAGCNNSKNPRVASSSQNDEIVKPQGQTQIDTCRNTKQIIQILNITLSSNRIDFIDTAQFRMLLQENNDYTDGCYFPSTIEDYALLYEFTDTLAYMCSHNENALQLLALLQAHNTTNAEYSEYFMGLFPRIAIDSIEMFVKGLYPLSVDYRNNILYDLGYLPDKETIEVLRNKIEKLNDPKLKSLIEELIRFLDNEDNFDF